MANRTARHGGPKANLIKSSNTENYNNRVIKAHNELQEFFAKFEKNNGEMNQEVM